MEEGTTVRAFPARAARHQEGASSSSGRAACGRGRRRRCHRRLSSRRRNENRTSCWGHCRVERLPEPSGATLTACRLPPESAGGTINAHPETLLGGDRPAGVWEPACWCLASFRWHR
ncbi:unnamed protein product [Phaeothamnion confervicola]